MPITIAPYRVEHEAAVRAFNDRLKAGQPDENLVFYSESTPRWLPRLSDRDIYNEYFVATDGRDARGAYALKWQNFLFPDGETRAIACYHHPLSEGVIDRSYSSIGALLMRDAINRAPLLYCLGMGGYDRPLPRMLIGLGWWHVLIPFHFRIVHPFRFLREMRALRSPAWRSVLMDVGAFTGAGWLATGAWRLFERIRSPRLQGVTARPVDEFCEWADVLWQEAKSRYALTAVRNRKALRTLYHGGSGNLRCLRVVQGDDDIGWAVTGERRKDSKYGAMRVGSIVDCWALPGHERAVIRTAAAALEERGVDLIVTNQSHATWSRAVRAEGFFSGPSNFIFAASRKLSELLAPFDQTMRRMHVTRADGDGLPDNF